MSRSLLRRADTRFLASAIHIAARTLQPVSRVLERSRQRRALGRLNDALLRDIGLTRHDVVRECARPFWRR